MISIESNTISEIDDRDFGLIKTTTEKFGKLTDLYDSFYTTIFFNEENRKVCLYFTYGKLKKLTFDKIDIEGK